MTRVSVAMATYNGARFIGAQLDSLARQTRLPDELVVVDDGSTDATVDLVARFATSAPFPVELHRNPQNLGYAQNFGRALAACTGEVVFPCDQDDVWFEEKIATLLDRLDAQPGRAAVLCDALLADAELKTDGATKLGRIRAGGLPDSAHVMGCCMALRRPLVDLALPIPPEVRAHDNWIMALADAGGMALRLDTPLQAYRLHGANASDFFVNRAGRMSVLDRATTRMARTLHRLRARGGMLEEHRLLAAVQRRLAERAGAFDALAGAQGPAARDRLETRTQALAQRVRVRGQARHNRLGPVLALWRSGAYGARRGGVSAVKDLLWPRLTDDGSAR